jgi:hypothetical protein
LYCTLVQAAQASDDMSGNDQMGDARRQLHIPSRSAMETSSAKDCTCIFSIT